MIVNMNAVIEKLLPLISYIYMRNIASDGKLCKTNQKKKNF